MWQHWIRFLKGFGRDREYKHDAQDKRVWHSFRSLHFTYHRQYNHTNTWIHWKGIASIHKKDLLTKLITSNPFVDFHSLPLRSCVAYVYFCLLRFYPSPGIIVLIISIYVRDVYNVRIWWCYYNNTLHHYSLQIRRTHKQTHTHTQCLNKWMAQRHKFIFINIWTLLPGKIGATIQSHNSLFMHLMVIRFVFYLFFHPWWVYFTTINVAILMRSFKIWFVIILGRKKLLSS